MYRFKDEFRDAIISIPSKRLTITRFNLSDEYAQLIFKKFPQFAHNIELVRDEPKLKPVQIIEPEEKKDIKLPTPKKEKAAPRTRRRTKE